MEYNNGAIRRQDRLLEEDKAFALLTHGDHGVLSLEFTASESRHSVISDFNNG